MKCQSNLSRPFSLRKAPATSLCRPWTPRPREAQRPALGGTARPGHIGMQTPDLGTCPPRTAPQLPQEGWRMVGGPSARQQRLRWGAGWPLAPPPPPRHRSLAPSTGRPAAGTSARAQTSIHTRALAPSFFSALLFPPQLVSFFFFFSPSSSSPLSLPTCHYSRNKKRGDNAGIDKGPLPAPSPHGACQHSFHPPRAGTAAKGALLINKRNQINQEHNRGICCT